MPQTSGEKSRTISEKTAAMLPELIQQAGINVPVMRVEETKTLIKLYLYGHTEPVVLRKPKATW